jgi:hypothetical protein
MTQRLHQRAEFERQYEYIFEDPQSQVMAIAPSGMPVADIPMVETDVTAIDQAALEEALATAETVTNPFNRTGFLMPFIVGFAAAWVARQLKVF